MWVKYERIIYLLMEQYSFFDYYAVIMIYTAL